MKSFSALRGMCRKTDMSEKICIRNIENYIQEIINGDLILTPRNLITNYITEQELYDLNIANSKIKNCVIKKDKTCISNNRNSYRSVLIDVWKIMSSEEILKNTTFNFKRNDNNGKKGYNWCSEIKMAFQSKDAKNTLVEIIKMIKLNKLSIELSIKLSTDKTIHFQIND